MGKRGPIKNVFTKHQTCTQNLKICLGSSKEVLISFRDKEKEIHVIMKILTDKNIFRKDLLFHITCLDFLSIFQQNSFS